MSWTCRCGETHDDSFEACWNCGNERAGQTSSAAAVLGPELPVGIVENEIKTNSDSVRVRLQQGSSGALLNECALKRYKDAYSVAASIDAHGQAIKILASIIAVITIVITLLVSTKAEGTTAGSLFFAGVITAAVLWATIHAHGVRIAAEGQHLLAALDVAVHTSPFLSDVERAQAMSLR